MVQPDFAKALLDREEITITVKGRRSGREIKFPVWFTLHGKMLHLLPIHGSRSQWYKNLVADPAITLQAGRQTLTAMGHLKQERSAVQHVVEEFQKKYGAKDVAQYYDYTDAIVDVPIDAGSEPGGPGKPRTKPTR